MKTAKLAVDFPPKCYLFCECNSQELTGLVRISKTRYCWKHLSLEQVMFINLYPASRGPSIFLDKSGSLKEHCVTRKKPEQYSNLERIKFQETSIFYTHYLKGFREMIYLSRNIRDLSELAGGRGGGNRGRVTTF